MVKMVYVGPGTKPAPMEVKEEEVAALEKTKLWKKASTKKPGKKKEDS